MIKWIEIGHVLVACQKLWFPKHWSQEENYLRDSGDNLRNVPKARRYHPKVKRDKKTVDDDQQKSWNYGDERFTRPNAKIDQDREINDEVMCKDNNLRPHEFPNVNSIRQSN